MDSAKRQFLASFLFFFFFGLALSSLVFRITDYVFEVAVVLWTSLFVSDLVGGCTSSSSSFWELSSSLGSRSISLSLGMVAYSTSFLSLLSNVNPVEAAVYDWF